MHAARFRVREGNAWEMFGRVGSQMVTVASMGGVFGGTCTFSIFYNVYFFLFVMSNPYLYF